MAFHSGGGGYGPTMAMGPPVAGPSPLIPANTNAGYPFMPHGRGNGPAAAAAMTTLPPLELDLTCDQMRALTAEIWAFLHRERASPPRANAAAATHRSLGGGRFAPIPRDQVAPVAAQRWRRGGATDGGAHAGEAVHALLAVEEDGEAALYSAAPGVLNCWRCAGTKPGNAVGGGGGGGGKGKRMRPDPLLALECAQKNTGYHIFSLCYVPPGKLLIGAGIESATQSPALLAISGDPLNNHLGPKDVRAPPALTLRVEALAPLPGLEGCVAASGDGSVTIFDLAARGDFSTQRTAWAAHAEFVTCLRCAPPQAGLLTGSQRGDIHSWDLRAPPHQPALALRYHTRLVTDLQIAPAGHALFSGSADGSVLEWDLRRPQAPVAMLIPDLRSVLALRLHPHQPHLLAISTLRGLYCLDVRDRSLAAVSPLEEKITYPAVEWNPQTGMLYACKLNGELEAWQPLAAAG